MGLPYNELKAQSVRGGVCGLEGRGEHPRGHAPLRAPPLQVRVPRASPG